MPEDPTARNWGASSRFAESIVLQSGLRTRQRGDAQGYYAISAAGDFYGGINTHDVDEVLGLLERARRRFAASPPKPVMLAETELGPEARVPTDAAVLRVFSRIDPLPEDTPPNSLNRSVGRDHLWILKDELDEIAARLDGADEAEAPPTLGARLVRFQLIDNVRGEPDMWRPKHVKHSSFRLDRVSENRATLTVALTGSYSMLMPADDHHKDGRHKAPEMGIEGTLRGLLEIAKDGGSLRWAQIFSSATAWGHSAFTPGAPQGKFAMKFAMVLTDDLLSPQIAPQGLMDSGREEYLRP